MKKKLISVLLTGAMVLSLAACGGNDTKGSGAAGSSASGGASTPAQDSSAAGGGEDNAPVIEGFADGKFTETRHIVVEVYDRGNDGGSKPADNMYTQYIKDGMLQKYNVEVEFKPVPRWTEVDEINNLLAAQNAPDICLTYSYPTIQTYADMGGVQDLAPYLEEYKSLMPNLWNWLGETNIYWDRNPNTGEVWAIEGKRAQRRNINTFVRKDWLETLGLKEPTSRQEFHDMLVAFKDNADKLLGADAGSMIPLSIGKDVGWRVMPLIESFMDPAITDYDLYIHSFDDRKFTQNGTKEAMRVLNQWYNEGLVWNEFAVQTDASIEDNKMKAGYVGAFMHNWDYPYRNGTDSIQANLVRNVGADAAYIAVDCFEDKNGDYTKYMQSTAGDRKIFFPITNKEPLASMLYLEFISTPEVIEYLQIGDEGVTHEKIDGGKAVRTLAATGAAIQNSGQNIDYTITCNGLNLVDPEMTANSLSNNYSEVDPALVDKALKVAENDGRTGKNVNVGTIESEIGATGLPGKRDIVYNNVVVCKPADFDKTWDDGMADYMSSGGQAIMDERIEKWKATYGDTESLPQ